MQKFFLKLICLVLFSSIVPGSELWGQVSHFIYLQTDNRQPFYIKYNNRIYSSSSSGYVIISKLKEGLVDFSMGFPKSEIPELKFQCTIDKTDKGYLIKNFDDKGWGLYDLQSSAITYANLLSDQKTNNPVVNQNQPAADDPFANMLSKITQDSTVKNVTVTKEKKRNTDTVVTAVTKPSVKEQPVQDVIKTDTPIAQTPAVIEEKPITETVWVAPLKTSVQQVRRFDSKEGSDFVFEVVESNGQKDTIRLFIEKDSSIVLIAPVLKNETKADTVVVKEPEITIRPAVDSPTVAIVEIPTQEEVKKPVNTQQKQDVKPLPNSNCKAIASDDDFMKLRRKMANESKDEAMVSEAKKVFKTRCFSTAQIKNLAVLFLNDEGRYRFYDAAALFITDFSNFKSLGETIQDEYYKKRFLALLPNQ